MGWRAFGGGALLGLLWRRGRVGAALLQLQYDPTALHPCPWHPPADLPPLLPLGCSCRGPAIYEKVVAPVLAAAGLEAAVHRTTHRRHATEILLAARPGQYDAIVSIGG